MSGSADPGPGPKIPLRFDWALRGKTPGGSDLCILTFNDGPFKESQFSEILWRFTPADPGIDTRRARPDSLPWATLSYAPLPGGQPALGLAIARWTDVVDSAGRPVPATSYFCLPFAALTRTPVSLLDLYDVLSDVRLADRSRGQVSRDVPAYDPARVMAEVVTDVESAARAALVGIAATRGPVALIGAEVLDGEQQVRKRLAFLDACLAFLPYGQRAGLAASTWANSAAAHHMRIAFTQHERDIDFPVWLSGDAVSSALEWSAGAGRVAGDYLRGLVEGFGRSGDPAAYASRIADVLVREPALRRARELDDLDGVLAAVGKVDPALMARELVRQADGGEDQLLRLFAVPEGDQAGAAPVDSFSPEDRLRLLLRLIGLPDPRPGSVKLAADARERWRRLGQALPERAEQEVVSTVAALAAREVATGPSLGKNRLPRLLNLAAKFEVSDRVLEAGLRELARSEASEEVWHRAAALVDGEVGKGRLCRADGGSTAADRVLAARLIDSPRLILELLARAVDEPWTGDGDPERLAAWLRRLDGLPAARDWTAPFAAIRAGAVPDLRVISAVGTGRHLLSVVRLAVLERNERALAAAGQAAVRQPGLLEAQRAGWLEAFARLAPDTELDASARASVDLLLLLLDVAPGHADLAGYLLRPAADWTYSQQFLHGWRQDTLAPYRKAMIPRLAEFVSRDDPARGPAAAPVLRLLAHAAAAAPGEDVGPLARAAGQVGRRAPARRRIVTVKPDPAPSTDPGGDLGDLLDREVVIPWIAALDRGLSPTGAARTVPGFPDDLAPRDRYWAVLRVDAGVADREGDPTPPDPTAVPPAGLLPRLITATLSEFPDDEPFGRWVSRDAVGDARSLSLIARAAPHYLEPDDWELLRYARDVLTQLREGPAPSGTDRQTTVPKRLDHALLSFRHDTSVGDDPDVAAAADAYAHVSLRRGRLSRPDAALRSVEGLAPKVARRPDLLAFVCAVAVTAPRRPLVGSDADDDLAQRRSRVRKGSDTGQIATDIMRGDLGPYVAARLAGEAAERIPGTLAVLADVIRVVHRYADKPTREQVDKVRDVLVDVAGPPERGRGPRRRKRATPDPSRPEPSPRGEGPG